MLIRFPSFSISRLFSTLGSGGREKGAGEYDISTPFYDNAENVVLLSHKDLHFINDIYSTGETFK